MKQDQTAMVMAPLRNMRPTQPIIENGWQLNDNFLLRMLDGADDWKPVELIVAPIQYAHLIEAWHKARHISDCEYHRNLFNFKYHKGYSRVPWGDQQFLDRAEPNWRALHAFFTPPPAPIAQAEGQGDTV